jgi:Type II secretion system (T2SS), protein M
MTGRDRIVLMVVIVLGLTAAGWILVVSPVRKEAKSIEGQVATAQTELSTAEGQLANAKAAQAQYASAYSSVVSLGKAVPASQEVPSLIVQLEQASNKRNVSFNSIVSASAGGTGGGAAGAGAAAAGFSQMPFTFGFSGGFFSLEHLFRQLTAFTNHTSGGDLQVSGRLLTIQTVKLTPEPSQKGGRGVNLTGTVTATAYVLPGSQGLTAGATPTSPTGAAAPAASSPAPAVSAHTPAVARITP